MTMPQVVVLGTEPHAITVANEIQATPVDGWWHHEKTGRVVAACTCGLSTDGYVDRSEFDANAWREHAGI